MDPLGAAASIIAVLQLTTSIIKYLDGVKGTSEDHARLRSVLCSAREILYIVDSRITAARNGDPWSANLQSLCAKDGPLDQFRLALQMIESRTLPPKGSKRLTTAIIWPFRKGEVNELLSHLEYLKSLFFFAQQNDHV